MEKLVFAIETEDEWPPVSSESVWCERIGPNYRILNTPFFIKGLAYGDVFSATPDPTSAQIFEFNVIEQSGNSVVWILNNDRIDISKFVEAIEALNCEIEGFPKFSLYSIKVPKTIDLSALDQLIKSWESKGLHFAYPTWRVEE